MVHMFVSYFAFIVYIYLCQPPGTKSPPIYKRGGADLRFTNGCPHLQIVYIYIYINKYMCVCIIYIKLHMLSILSIFFINLYILYIYNILVGKIIYYKLYSNFSAFIFKIPLFWVQKTNKKHYNPFKIKNTSSRDSHRITTYIQQQPVLMLRASRTFSVSLLFNIMQKNMLYYMIHLV